MGARILIVDDEDNHRKSLSIGLRLEGFEVVEASEDRAGKVRRLAVVPADVAGLCPHCGRATDDRHACRDREVMDLPLGGWKTRLVVRVWQFRCGGCGKFFTPRHPALADGAHATERFLGRLADLATHGDVAAAARFFGVAEKTAERWYYDHLADLDRRRQGPPKGPGPVRSLGIDELSTKKGTVGSRAC
jgi:transposase